MMLFAKAPNISVSTGTLFRYADGRLSFLKTPSGRCPGRLALRESRDSRPPPVIMAVHPQDRTVTKTMLSSEIELVEFSMNAGWSRNSAPMILVDGKEGRAVAGFEFNGWGPNFPLTMMMHN